MYLNLHQAIVQLATTGAGAYRRHRTDVLNTCKSLDDLCVGLVKEGYILSWQALYLHLSLRRIDNMEGKRHVRTVPVKLHKAQNNLQNQHTNGDFMFTTKQFLQDIVALFGSKSVFVISVDDKVKVPIDVTAATKLAQLVMHGSYEI